MAMYEPLCLPPNADEQDFVQAYENVREKYKGITDWEIGVTGSDDMNVCVCLLEHTRCLSVCLWSLVTFSVCLLEPRAVVLQLLVCENTHAVCQSVSGVW